MLRLGDVAIATNPFELYLDYATRIEARSRATLTMLVQLSCGGSGYLPTQSADARRRLQRRQVPRRAGGGQVLVEETVQRINELWP